MKKGIAVLLGAACFTSLLAGCAPTVVTPTKKDFDEIAEYWTATSTVKYLNDGWDSTAKNYKAQDVSDAEKESKTLELDGLKGEAVGYQLVFLAKEQVKNYNFTIDGDLAGPDGAKISKDQISVYAEHYFEVYQPTSTATYKPQTGYYPDALIPIERYIARRQDKVNKDWLQAIWINCDIPRDCVPGEYTGTGTLTVNGQSVTVNISADVVNVEMPEKVTPRSAFAIWYDHVTFGEGDNMNDDTYANYYEFMLSKRLTPTSMIPDKMSSMDAFIQGAVEVSQDPRATVYRSYNSGDNGDITGMLTALMNKNLELRRAGDMETDLFEKLMVYVFDEPGVNGIPYDSIRDFDKNIYESKKAVKALLAKVTDVDTTDLQESVMKVAHLVTFMSEGIDERLIATEDKGGVQTWCPHMNWCWYGGKEEILERLNSTARDGGDDVWWYWCVTGAPGITYLTDDIAVGPRVASWKQYELQISGTLYWNVACYRYYNNTAYVDRDVYNDPLTYGTLNGEGQLIYPGAYYGLNEPLSSIRLENIRDGQEDFEYLLLLENGVNKLEGFKGRGKEVVDLIVERMMDADGNYNRDHTVFDGVLGEVFELLDAVYNDADAAKVLVANLLK